MMPACQVRKAHQPVFLTGRLQQHMQAAQRLHLRWVCRAGCRAAPPPLLLHQVHNLAPVKLAAARNKQGPAAAAAVGAPATLGSTTSGSPGAHVACPAKPLAAVCTAPAAAPPQQGVISYHVPASRTFSPQWAAVCRTSCLTQQSWVPLTSLQHGCQARHRSSHLWRSLRAGCRSLFRQHSYRVCYSEVCCSNVWMLGCACSTSVLAANTMIASVALLARGMRQILETSCTQICQQCVDDWRFQGRAQLHVGAVRCIKLIPTNPLLHTCS
jgi:hypothetical protein